jgi:hypothetical protein
MTEAISMKAEFDVGDTALVVDYEVSNSSHRDVYLLNKLQRPAPAGETDANLVYIQLDPASRAVRLSKRIPEIPPGVLVYQPISPYITPLRAGERFREVFHVALPIEEYAAYGLPARSAPTHPEVYERVDFTLQYFWRTEGMLESTVTINTHEILVARGGAPLKPSDFGFLEAERLRLTIPVLAL